MNPDAQGDVRSLQSVTPTGISGRLITADRVVDTDLCTLGGVTHDYRPRTYERYGKPHTSWVCVWCAVVACGDYDEPDPCMEPYHHTTPHRTRSGVTWLIGGDRP